MLKKGSIPSVNLSPQYLQENVEHIFEEEVSEEETDTCNDECLSNCENCNSESECNNVGMNELQNLEEEEYISDVVPDQLKNNEQVIRVGNDCSLVDKEIQTFENLNEIKQLSCVIDKSVQTEGQNNFMDLLRSDKDIHAFTGISLCTLIALTKAVNLIGNKQNDKHLCSLKERIVLVLCKLKLDLSFDRLAVLFKISKSTACNYFFETVQKLACVLEEAIYLPTKEEIKENIPQPFKDFEDTRIVLDCTEVPVENSKCLQCRLKTYSHYKGRQTLKILIGTTPSGLISYCSKCYGGRASDKSIFLQSKLLDRLTPGEDAIMTDKGFLIQSECQEYKIKLIRPPFTSQNQQMSTEESQRTRKIAAARVHVERVMERLKNFKILKSRITWEISKYMDKIMIIICGLVNLSRPIMNKSRYSS